ncbi:MAG: hypothetical protein HQK49_07430, partial [Oligoflexia bacterium]|nr:hypothetical protein [Oligoflexia bacterium]
MMKFIDFVSLKIAWNLLGRSKKIKKDALFFCHYPESAGSRSHILFRVIGVASIQALRALENNFLGSCLLLKR